MTGTKDNAITGTGYAFLGEERIFNITQAAITLGLENIDIPLQGSRYLKPTKQPISGRIQCTGLNMQILANLTGGTVATGSTRTKNETLTKVTTTITLSETPKDNDELSIIPVGSNKAPLEKVAETPGVGEFSVSGTAVTINAGQSETDFVCVYPFDDSSNGESITLAPSDLPSSFGIFLSIDSTDMFPKTDGEFTLYASACQRDGDLELAGALDSHTPFEINFNVVNQSSGDVKISHAYDSYS